MLMTESYVTVATDDISCLSCLVLCNSLKQTGTEKILSVIVDPIVSCHLKSVLQKSFDKVYCINDLHVIFDGQNRFDVHGDYQRLKCWLLTEFTKCVFLESDVLVVENIDDLFDRFELSAISDPRWPDCFDAGVFVFQPSLKTYKNLIDYSVNNQIAGNSFQCLLNMFFCEWSHISIERKIPFTYNCQMNTTFYTHTSALVHFGHSIKAARLGNSAFNLMQPNPSMSGPSQDNWSRLWSQWWKIFNENVKPAVDNDDKFNFKRSGVDYNLPSQHESHPSDVSSHSHVAHQSQESACSIHEQSQTSQGSVFQIQETIGESSCPSQDYVVHSEQQCRPPDHVRESFSEDEPSVTLCDKLDGKPSQELHSDTSDGDNAAQLYLDKDSENAEKDHRLRWERGEIDYMGEDSFANILAQLNSTIVSSSDEEQNVKSEEQSNCSSSNI